MSVRPLRLIGDPVLRSRCRPVTQFNDATARLVQDLLDTVALPGRAGLAAPQIGIDLAAFSYNVEGQLGYLLNPSIVETSGEYDGPEGCLSVPGMWMDTPRARHAVVHGVDKHGQPVRVEGSGEFARCLQHETDHLAGLLYLDRLTGERRRAAFRTLRSQQTGTADHCS